METATATLSETRGILTPGALDRKFRLTRLPPSADLAHVVERYWTVEWHLPGRETHVQETLPFPCVNLAIERGRSGVFGVSRRRFTITLEGSGRVFAVKFRPGAFHSFVSYPVSRLTDRALPLRDVFGHAGDSLEAEVLVLGCDEERIAAVEGFLRERRVEPDETVELVNRVIDQVIDDRAITKVDELVSRVGLSKRTLQRTFARYVGASPKWVIQRYRLQEAADRLAGGDAVSLPELALDLGYCDQAHFIHDFKAIVGLSPAEYARRAACVASGDPTLLSHAQQPLGA
jgi:AraC-like DNA-binding protein